jgi:ubiquinol-cytochrome c reductase iron-sulfur subunit
MEDSQVKPNGGVFMTTNVVNTSRRRMLTGITVGLSAVGAGFVAVPFLGSWAPSERTKAAGAPVEVDISKIEKGMMIRIKWRGKPVYILRRTPKQLAELKIMTASGKLRDPQSQVQTQQPAYAQNEYRSIKEEFIVMLGICTHLGCAPTYKPDEGSLISGLPGGYFCPCHGSKFDLAGRVYVNVPAPTNLVVPPHYYINDSLVLVGEDKGAA